MTSQHCRCWWSVAAPLTDLFHSCSRPRWDMLLFLLHLLLWLWLLSSVSCYSDFKQDTCLFTKVKMGWSEKLRCVPVTLPQWQHNTCSSTALCRTFQEVQHGQKWQPIEKLDDDFAGLKRTANPFTMSIIGQSQMCHSVGSDNTTLASAPSSNSTAWSEVTSLREELDGDLVGLKMTAHLFTKLETGQSET